mmetsp:Transcript_93431/g.264529  ORF Transcript_93431/g.264529 Transcript_93431/m.264529 type:complete len:315 (+) Transcript_93431:19-963(+)
MRVLVTGGTGYVGRAVVERLAAECEVVVASRSTSPVSLDVADGGSCERALREVRPDVVVHAAALSSPGECEREPRRCWEVNACRCLLDAAASASPAARFVLLSTDQVLGGSGHRVDEREPPSPVNAYGRSKAAMEGLVREAFPEPRHAVLRLSFVYGPAVDGAHATFLQFALDRLRGDGPCDAFTDQIRSCVYIADVVDAVQYAVHGRLSGTVNVGGPEALSRYDFCRTVADSCELPADKIRGVLYASVAGMPPSPADISMDASKLAAALGRQTHTLAQALEAMGLTPATGRQAEGQRDGRRATSDGDHTSRRP